MDSAPFSTATSLISILSDPQDDPFFKSAPEDVNDSVWVVDREKKPKNEGPQGSMLFGHNGSNPCPNSNSSDNNANFQWSA